MKIYTPDELLFDIGTDPDLGTYVYIVPIDPDSEDADNLGHHNVTGLPDYFDVEEMECTWSSPDKTEEELKTDLIAAGFTYEKILEDN
jgi:hypothetical protein